MTELIVSKKHQEKENEAGEKNDDDSSGTEKDPNPIPNIASFDLPVAKK